MSPVRIRLEADTPAELQAAIARLKAAGGDIQLKTPPYVNKCGDGVRVYAEWVMDTPPAPVTGMAQKIDDARRRSETYATRGDGMLAAYYAGYGDGLAADSE